MKPNVFSQRTEDVTGRSPLLHTERFPAVLQYHISGSHKPQQAHHRPQRKAGITAEICQTSAAPIPILNICPSLGMALWWALFMKNGLTVESQFLIISSYYKLIRERGAKRNVNGSILSFVVMLHRLAAFIQFYFNSQHIDVSERHLRRSQTNWFHTFELKYIQSKICYVRNVIKKQY